MDTSPNATLLAALKRTLERLEYHVAQIPAAQRTSADQLALEFARATVYRIEKLTPKPPR